MHPLLKFVKGPVTNVYFFVVVSALFLLYASSEIYSAVVCEIEFIYCIKFSIVQQLSFLAW